MRIKQNINVFKDNKLLCTLGSYNDVVDPMDFKGLDLVIKRIEAGKLTREEIVYNLYKETYGYYVDNTRDDGLPRFESYGMIDIDKKLIAYMGYERYSLENYEENNVGMGEHLINKDGKYYMLYDGSDELDELEEIVDEENIFKRMILTFDEFHYLIKYVKKAEETDKHFYVLNRKNLLYIE